MAGKVHSRENMRKGRDFWTRNDPMEGLVIYVKFRINFS